MSDYIKMWVEIISTMNNDNTYKIVWGKALIEIIVESEIEDERFVISFEEIARKMLKYYWNQVFFFNLKQSPSNTPVVVQQVERCINYYIGIVESKLPVWFDYAESTLKENAEFYNDAIHKIALTLKKDVSWRFLKSSNGSLDIYVLDKEKGEVYFTFKQMVEVKQYSVILAQLLNLKWAELLERFNSSPRIVSKVKGISETKLRRKSLKKFEVELVKSFEDDEVYDFYTGDKLEEGNISVDHVIPWSFMYSDDIWNLVITSRSNNSRKSNHIPSDDDIRRLIERNKQLVEIAENKKFRQDLRNAIENDYVNKFYLAFKL